LYAAIGYYLYANYDGTFREMGAVAIWAGLFTILFGIYFGIDVFGYHAYQLLDLKWEVGKGLSPADTSWALAWLTLSVLFGILHLNVGYALSFVTNLQQHDLKHTMYESGSWLLLLNGLWLWIFSKHLMGAKPAFLFDSVSVISLGAVSFTGLPTVVGFAGLAGAAVGFLLLAIGEPVEIAEALSPIVNVISYARIMAVLLAKGGMALAVNLLAFGAYIDDGGAGSFHFIFTSSKLTEVNGTDSYQLVFAGLSPFAELTPVGIAAIAGAVIIAVAGHVVVLLLGITAAGIQGIRLEYVEFFGKFYEGGGDPYTPFGYDRQYTSEE
jgi:V/A-type H+-transporting ATPase subunit I